MFVFLRTCVLTGWAHVACKYSYIDFSSSAVRRFSDSEQLPEDGQVGPKRVAIDVILMLF
jgi:hypothetical protein